MASPIPELPPSITIRFPSKVMVASSSALMR
jgi:hypothetical protein